MIVYLLAIVVLPLYFVVKILADSQKERMSIQVDVAKQKEKHPERFCPERGCLWRTNDGSHCPRHKSHERKAD